MNNHMKIHGANCDRLITYSEKFDEYGIPDYVSHDYKDAPVQIIKFCPWCGETLPESQRDRWFDELAVLGVNPRFDEIPEKYKGSEWRRKDVKD